MKKVITAFLMLAAINCTAQDFKPTIVMDGNTFALLQTKAFFINVQEISNIPSSGNLSFRLVQPSGLTYSWQTTSGTATNNGVWTITKSGNIITCTTTSIAALGSSIVGFTATRNNGVTTNTTMNITAVITKNSGGDTNALNNTTVLQTIAN